MRFIKTELAKQLENEVVNPKVGAAGSHTKQYPGLDFTPTRATDGSAGFDLRACIFAPITICPDQVVKIPTGVKIWIGSEDGVTQAFEDGGSGTVAGLLFPRSSTAGAILNNTVGIIDCDYQGEVFIKLRNITAENITIAVGEAFAQVVFTPVFLPMLEEVKDFEQVTVRGEGSFGSTGK